MHVRLHKNFHLVKLSRQEQAANSYWQLPVIGPLLSLKVIHDESLCIPWRSHDSRFVGSIVSRRQAVKEGIICPRVLSLRSLSDAACTCTQTAPEMQPLSLRAPKRGPEVRGDNSINGWLALAGPVSLS